MAIALGGGIPIKDVLSSRLQFILPEYQRDYAWDKGDSLQLVGDFSDELKALAAAPKRADTSYYLGTIVLAMVEAAKGAQTAEIVDGQQRLATLTILLACLRDLETDKKRKQALDGLILMPPAGRGASPAFVLTLRGRDGEFMRQHVQPAGSAGSALPKPRPNRKIIAARESLREFVSGLSETDRRRLADFVMNACRVAVVTTHSREQAWRIFGRLNQRGKRLSTADILKALIIGAIPADKRAHYVGIWTGYQQKLGEHFDGDALGRRYLFNYIAELGERSGENILDSVIAQVERLGAPAFMDKVFEPVAKAYVAVVKQQYSAGTKAEQEHVIAALKQLSWLPRQHWVAVAILLMRRYANDPARLIAQLAVLDRYFYGQMLLKRNWHKMPYNKPDSVRNAIKALGGPDADVDLAQHLRWSKGEMKLLRNALDYGMSGGPAKVVLARLAQALGELSLGQCEDIVRSPKWEVEHFVPASPQVNNDWQQVLGNVTVGQYAKKLGNLYLVRASLNDALGNKHWAHKSKVLADNPTEPLLPLGESVRKPGWGAASIDQRHQALVETANALWQIEGPPKGPVPDPVPKPKPKRPRRRRRKAKSKGTT